VTLSAMYCLWWKFRQLIHVDIESRAHNLCWNCRWCVTRELYKRYKCTLSLCVFVCLMRKGDGGKRLKVNVKLFLHLGSSSHAAKRHPLKWRVWTISAAIRSLGRRLKLFMIARHLWVNLHARVQLDFHLLLLIEADARWNLINVRYIIGSNNIPKIL